jgi:hypothetical protein
MQLSTLFATGSVAVASILLVGPCSAVHTLGNIEGAALGRTQDERDNTKIAAEERVAMCARMEALYDRFVPPRRVRSSPPGREIIKDLPGTALICSAGSSTAEESSPDERSSPARESQPAGTGDLPGNEYKNSVEEIRTRIGQEEILFGLKFTLIGGIMAVLFSLFKGEEKDYFEKLVQRRRAAAFFSAALLTSVIVDARLRFNAKIIESLGKWVWCMETRELAARTARNFIPWEGFLHFELDAGANPLMRYSSHLLTSLLYGVMLYLFVVMPRTVNRSTRTMLGHSGTAFFLILACIAISYDCPYGRELAMLGAVGAALLALLGAGLLRLAFQTRFETSNACRLTQEILEDIEKNSHQEEPPGTASQWILNPLVATELRNSFNIASRVLEPANFFQRLRSNSPDLERLRWEIRVEQNWEKANSAWLRLEKLRKGVKHSEKDCLSKRGLLHFLKSRLRRFWWRMRNISGKQYYSSRLAAALRPKNIESTDRAEEVLWDLYFENCKKRRSWIVEVGQKTASRRPPDAADLAAGDEQS